MMDWIFVDGSYARDSINMKHYVGMYSCFFLTISQFEEYSAGSYLDGPHPDSIFLLVASDFIMPECS